MTRSRLVVSFSALVVVVGALVGLGVVVLNPARAAVGPLAAEAMVLPADTNYVAGLDVKRFLASPFYAKYAKDRKNIQIDTFSELETKTGIKVERDVTRIVMAGSKGRPGVILVTGTFDRHTLGRYIEQQKGVTAKKLFGTEVYMYNEEKKGAGALAFLDDRTLVLGEQPVVETILGHHADGKRPLRSNPSMVDLLSKVKPGSTFWMVGDKTLLADMPKGIPIPSTGMPGAPAGEAGDAKGSGTTTLALPPLQSLTVTADLDPVVAFEATGAAADEVTAQKLADVVRGLVALATLQAQQNPELKSLASAVNVSTETTKVHLTAQIPYATIDALTAKKTAPAPAPRP